MLLLPLLLLLPAALSAQDLSTAAYRPVTISEAYAAALTRSESLAAGKEGLAELDAAERAATAALRPVLDLNASHSKEQPSAAATRAWFGGRYTFFSGLRARLAAKAASARGKAAALELKRAERLLYLDAAAACLNLYQAQREVLIRGEQLRVSAKRIEELRSRVALGRSRSSELTAAQAQLAGDRAGHIAAQSAEKAAQEALAFLTGLEGPLAPEPPPLRAEGRLEDYLKAVQNREDLLAARSETDYYGLLLDAEDRNMLPEAWLYGNFFPVRLPAPDSPNRWDAGVQLKVPLYNGGLSGARRQGAWSARRAAELRYAGAARRAASEVRLAWEELSFAARRTAALEEALALAAENADLQQQDYRLGLVTNLEVLSALNILQQDRLALSQARAAQLYQLLRLEAAAGLEAR